MFKKVLSVSAIVASLGTISYVNADSYTEIDCSADSVFSENGCNQCFDGGTKKAGDTIIGLSDIWENNTSYDQLMYEEMIEEPTMVTLASNEVNWTKDQIDPKFWKTTDAVKALYDDTLLGFVLKPGNKVTWLESTEGAGYYLEKNTAAAGTKIGLLIYPTKVMPVVDGAVDDYVEHKECVLFKSGGEGEKVVEKKELPKTGPEHYFLLLLLAMFIAFGVLRFKRA